MFAGRVFETFFTYGRWIGFNSKYIFFVYTHQQLPPSIPCQFQIRLFWKVEADPDNCMKRCKDQELEAEVEMFLGT